MIQVRIAGMKTTSRSFCLLFCIAFAATSLAFLISASRAATAHPATGSALNHAIPAADSAEHLEALDVEHGPKAPAQSRAVRTLPGARISS